MLFKKQMLSSAVALAGAFAVSSPAVAFTMDVNLDGNDATAETLEIYGTARLSLDYADSDLESSAQEDASAGLVDGAVSLSANTSLFGVRGSYQIEDSPYKVIWQMEQSIRPDTGSGDTFEPRNTFLGVDTPAGVFRAGILDTPFKEMGLGHTLYNTTAADPHAIIGASSKSPMRLDLRATNALSWTKDLSGVKLTAMYGLGQQKEGLEEIRLPDDNDSSMYSLGASYDLNGLVLSTAYVNYDNVYGGEVDAWRAGAKYTVGDLAVGVIYGDIDADADVGVAPVHPLLGTKLDSGSLSRAEYGAFAQYSIARGTMIGAQWMHADKSELGKRFGIDDSADQYSLGVYQAFSKDLLVHAVATKTVNDDAGAYGSAAYAHGDRISTVAGASPVVLSVGVQYSF